MMGVLNLFENQRFIGKYEWPETKENMLMGLCPMNYHNISDNDWSFGDAEKLHAQGYHEEAKQVNEILGDRLIKWKKAHEEEFELYYTYDTIIIQAENILEWNEELHDELCDEFNVILLEHNKLKTYQHDNFKLKYSYIYIAWIDTNRIHELEKTKKKYNLSWNEIF